MYKNSLTNARIAVGGVEVKVWTAEIDGKKKNEKKTLGKKLIMMNWKKDNKLLFLLKIHFMNTSMNSTIL